MPLPIMMSSLVWLSVFFLPTISLASSSTKTPVATCCPPGSFLAIEDWQGSRQLPNGLWVDSEDEILSDGDARWKYPIASPLWALRRSFPVDRLEYIPHSIYNAANKFGRHNYISRVFCLPDKNNLPSIDGFAGSSYPDPPYFASVEDKLYESFREVRNGTKPLADTQILQSTGDRLPSCPGGPNELATIILGDGRSSSYSKDFTSPLLRINDEGKLVGRYLGVFGSTDRLRWGIGLPISSEEDCEGEECQLRPPLAQETELGVDFCLTWSFDPRTQLVPFDPTTKSSTSTTPNPVLQYYLEGQGCQGLEDEDQFLACQNQFEELERIRTRNVEEEFIQRGPIRLLEAVYCDPCKAKVLCYYLTANWWVPASVWERGLSKSLDPTFWGDLQPAELDFWVYPLLSYLDADRDGKVTIHEFYDMKIVQILKIIFDGLDANGDGVVKQHEARLESFLRRDFLYSLTEELFDYADISNDNEISVEDIPLCQRGGSPFCLNIRDPVSGNIRDLANKTEENCHFFPSDSRSIYSPLRQVCTTLMNNFLSLEFDTIDKIHLSLGELKIKVSSILDFFRAKPSKRQVGLEEIVEGFARLGEPPQVVDSLRQLLTPILNTFPRMILQSLVSSADKNLDGSMDWKEFEGFGDFELVFKRWPQMWNILQDDMLAGINRNCYPLPWTTEDLKRYFSKSEVIIRLIHNLFFHEDFQFGFVPFPM